MRNAMRCFIALATIMVVIGGATGLIADEKSEAPVKDLMNAYVESFNKGQSDAMASYWREDGVYIDRGTGEKTKGRAAIVASLAETFGRPEKLRLQLSVTEVRFITPDVAQVEGVATITAADAVPLITNVSAIAIKTEGAKPSGWQLSSVEEVPPAVPESAAEALAPLSWLVGEWKDKTEGDKGAKSTFRWGANQSFLIRAFVGSNNADEETEGTQVIGWDPIARNIRSWTFFSDGSFGEAQWTKVGDSWSIKSTQTLADGRIATGTFLLERVDADTIKLALVGHEVDGEPLPAQPAVVAARQRDATTVEVKPADPSKTTAPTGKTKSK